MRVALSLRLGLVGLVVVAGTAVAGPKKLPSTLEKAAGKAFVAAQEADAKGDLNLATKQYQRAIEIAPHPDAYFNLADVQVRAKNVASAIRSYEKYLELAPEAKDRAAVEKRIAELLAMKGTLEMKFDEPDGLVFANGVLLGKMRGNYPLRAGTYHIDVITPITYGSGTCEATALRSSTCLVVPAGDVLTYAFITAPEVIESHSRECLDLKITHRRVTFD